MNFYYLWSKFIKKIRGSALLNSSIHQTSKVESGSQLINVSMGKYSFCGYDCEIVNCKIGSFVSIANGVIIGGGMHPVDWVGMSPVFYKGRDSVKAKFSEFDRQDPKISIIGHDVWIGRNAMIKQGVNIGSGSVIGMGSIVTKDVPPYSIFAGNPAKLIRKRFSEKIIVELLESEWWEMDEKLLKTAAVDIRNPELFLKHFQ